MELLAGLEEQYYNAAGTQITRQFTSTRERESSKKKKEATCELAQTFSEAL